MIASRSTLCAFIFWFFSFVLNLRRHEVSRLIQRKTLDRGPSILSCPGQCRKAWSTTKILALLSNSSSSPSLFGIGVLP
jgi:hypothetical protein